MKTHKKRSWHTQGIATSDARLRNNQLPQTNLKPLFGCMLAPVCMQSKIASTLCISQLDTQTNNQTKETSELVASVQRHQVQYHTVTGGGRFFSSIPSIRFVSQRVSQGAHKLPFGTSWRTRGAAPLSRRRFLFCTAKIRAYVWYRVAGRQQSPSLHDDIKQTVVLRVVVFRRRKQFGSCSLSLIKGVV